jgi:hypothetical protein
MRTVRRTDRRDELNRGIFLGLILFFENRVIAIPLVQTEAKSL